MVPQQGWQTPQNSIQQAQSGNAAAHQSNNQQLQQQPHQQQQQTPMFPNPPPQSKQLPNIQIQPQIQPQKQPQQNANNIDEQYDNEIYQENEPLNQLRAYNHKISNLKEKQQLLKCSLQVHQKEVRELFANLYEKKKKLLDMVIDRCNQNQFEVDIGVKEELQELIQVINKQNNQITKLRSEVDSMGISGVDNDKNTILLKKIGEDIQKQVDYASKFASTQYVRDYLQKTHIFKVSYEDVRYEYETKIRLKSQLEHEKQLYDSKKQMLNKAIQNQAKKCLQLEAQRDRLLQIVRQNAQKTAK